MLPSLLLDFQGVKWTGRLHYCHSQNVFIPILNRKYDRFGVIKGTAERNEAAKLKKAACTKMAFVLAALSLPSFNMPWYVFFFYYYYEWDEILGSFNGSFPIADWWTWFRQVTSSSPSLEIDTLVLSNTIVYWYLIGLYVRSNRKVIMTSKEN